MFSARTSKGEISIHEKVKKYKVEIIIIIIKDTIQAKNHENGIEGSCFLARCHAFLPV